jgi:hypothetical protein
LKSASRKPLINIIHESLFEYQFSKLYINNKPLLTII